uniref:Uncharacterized protein n=1 Tax=Bos indicus x Bos taurus TaxID=30522 RepID=A0A4W2HZA7_BOBOX
LPRPRASLTAKKKKILSTNQAPVPEEKGRVGHAKKGEEEEGRTDTELPAPETEGCPRCWGQVPAIAEKKDPSSGITSLTLHSAPFSSLSTALTPTNLCLLVPLAAG